MDTSRRRIEAEKKSPRQHFSLNRPLASLLISRFRVEKIKINNSFLSFDFVQVVQNFIAVTLCSPNRITTDHTRKLYRSRGNINCKLCQP